MNYKTPTELVDYLLHVAVEKGNKKLYKLVILGIMAGIFIALGSVGNIIVSSSLIKVDPGVAKFLGAAVFPVGLMMVVILGSELFTSNTMIVLGTYNKSITMKHVLYNWSVVYFTNFIGAMIVAYITIKTDNFDENSIELLRSMALHKTHTAPHLIFLKGIMCNILVCGAVLLAYAAKDIVGKLFGIWFPIMLFIILGYDHCVANMFYLSAAMIGNLGITYGGMFMNLAAATLGNIVGGAFVIGTSLYLTYYKGK